VDTQDIVALALVVIPATLVVRVILDTLGLGLLAILATPGFPAIQVIVVPLVTLAIPEFQDTVATVVQEFLVIPVTLEFPVTVVIVGLLAILDTVVPEYQAIQDTLESLDILVIAAILATAVPEYQAIQDIVGVLVTQDILEFPVIVVIVALRDIVAILVLE